MRRDSLYVLTAAMYALRACVEPTPLRCFCVVLLAIYTMGVCELEESSPSHVGHDLAFRLEAIVLLAINGWFAYEIYSAVA